MNIKALIATVLIMSIAISVIGFGVWGFLYYPKESEKTCLVLIALVVIGLIGGGIYHELKDRYTEKETFEEL